MKLTLQVLYTPSKHTLPADKESKRSQKGDIIQAYPSNVVIEPPSPNSKCIFIRLTDFPDSLRNKYLSIFRPHTRTFINEINEIDTEYVNKFQISINTDQLTTKEVTEIETNREVSMTWARFIQLTTNKETGALVKDGDFQ